MTEAEEPSPARNTPTSPPDLPYRGLEFFDVQHADNYFGRQAMTAKLLAKVQECNFIAVVGPSGSGKSSLVRAGLMVALQKGDSISSKKWLTPKPFSPGEDPLYAFCTALAMLEYPTTTDSGDIAWRSRQWAAKIADDSLKIGDLLSVLKAKHSEEIQILLIVDQFEETFTLCSDEKVRASFLDTLLAAAEKSWLTVIFTLRADFYGRVLEQESFSKRVDAGLVNVLPMTQKERRAAIEQPALQAGRSFESGLVERILDAVESEPGQLPVL